MLEQDVYGKIFATASQTGQKDLADLALRHLQGSGDGSLDLTGIDTAVASELNAQVQLLQALARPGEQSGAARSIGSNGSKASQESFDPRDKFDQVIQSIIDRISLYAALHERSWISRTLHKGRRQKTLKRGLKEFCGQKLVMNFGMSDRARRYHLGGNSSEHHCRLGEYLGMYPRSIDISERHHKYLAIDTYFKPSITNSCSNCRILCLYVWSLQGGSTVPTKIKWTASSRLQAT